MQQQFSSVRQQLLEKGQVLKATSCGEHAFLKMENLFYDILELAHIQKDSSFKEVLLVQLQIVKAGKFQLTQQLFQKARQRELAICQFRTALSKVLVTYLKAVKNKNLGMLENL